MDSRRRQSGVLVSPLFQSQYLRAADEAADHSLQSDRHVPIVKLLGPVGGPLVAPHGVQAGDDRVGAAG